MKWFGKDWGAAVCRQTDHTVALEGSHCGGCGEQIAPDDQGLLIPNGQAMDLRYIPWHLECLLGHLCDASAIRVGPGHSIKAIKIPFKELSAVGTVISARIFESDPVDPAEGASLGRSLAAWSNKAAEEHGPGRAMIALATCAATSLLRGGLSGGEALAFFASAIVSASELESEPKPRGQ